MVLSWALATGLRCSRRTGCGKAWVSLQGRWQRNIKPDSLPGLFAQHFRRYRMCKHANKHGCRQQDVANKCRHFWHKTTATTWMQVQDVQACEQALADREHVQSRAGARMLKLTSATEGNGE